MALNPRIYAAGDWAVSEEKGSNRTCLGGAAMDPNGLLYILPDIFWKVAGPKEILSNFIDFLKRRDPLMFWSEKGHISKAWGPFFKEEMLKQNVYSYITEVVPHKDKEVRAQSIRGLMSMQRVLFPDFADWWPEAIHEMLLFPGGRNDDFVDFISHLGREIQNMQRAEKKKVVAPDSTEWKPTLAWIKASDNRNRKMTVKYQGR